MSEIMWKSRRLGAAEALLAAAASLFAERGYAGTSVSLLARRAGVNPALVSYHFGGKAGLRSALEARLASFLTVAGGRGATASSWRAGLEDRLRRRPEAARLVLRDALDRTEGSGPGLLDRLASDLAGLLPAPGGGLSEARRQVAALIAPLALGRAAPPTRQDPAQET